MVNELLDVFPEEFSRMPPDRVVFIIELHLDMAPISCQPYQMPPNELIELEL